MENARKNQFEFVGTILMAVCTLLSSAVADDALDIKGRWRTARSTPDIEQAKALESLASIGYLGGIITAPDDKNITIYDSKRALNGLNFYTSGHAPEAILMDMSGNILHKWRHNFKDAFPDSKPPKDKELAHFWRKAHLFPNGDLIAIFEGTGLIKIDKESKLIWSLQNGAHHDLEVMKNGDIHVLTRKALIKQIFDKATPILEDFITVISADGHFKSEISIFDILYQSPHFKKLVRKSLSGDITHTNTIRILDGKWVKRAPALQAGNVLISIPRSNSLVILDPRKRAIVWWQKGPYRFQHDPKLLDNGNLLVFDNQGKPNRSQVWEFSFPSMQLIWKYEGSETRPFYSESCSTATRLGNGNTLIVESDPGRAFEVTTGGDIVWEFYNPHRAGENKEYIATILQMDRLQPDQVSWLKR